MLLLFFMLMTSFSLATLFSPTGLTNSLTLSHEAKWIYFVSIVLSLGAIFLSFGLLFNWIHL